MSTITTQDGTQIYYKDWGTGQPVVFSHGWPLTADAWDPQMMYLAERGYRAIAHDRRGHGRSSQPWDGNEMDTYADDLAALTAALDLRDAVHVGHSTGGGWSCRSPVRGIRKIWDAKARKGENAKKRGRREQNRQAGQSGDGSGTIPRPHPRLAAFVAFASSRFGPFALSCSACRGA